MATRKFKITLEDHFLFILVGGDYPEAGYEDFWESAVEGARDKGGS